MGHPAAHPLQPLAELGHEIVADERREQRHLRQREVARRPVPADLGQDRVAGAHCGVPFIRFCLYQAWKLWRGASGISRFFPQVFSGL